MKRFRFLTLTSLAALAACAPPDSALRVDVTVRAQGAARVRADCLKLTVSNESQELKSVTIKRPADDTAVFAVRRGRDLPRTIKLQAIGLLGSNCGDDTTLKLNAQGEAETGVFPESGVAALSLFLDPPGSMLDADRDGFVGSARGGLDCKDNDNTVFPGAGQICATTTDTDCDGLTGCDDTECGSAAVCADPPERVLITTSVATMLRHECRGPFRVELHNAAGVRTAIRDTSVDLTASLPGVTVHGVSNCNDVPLAAHPIPYGQSFFEVYLKADNQAFGIATLSATASRVPMAGTATVEVHPQPIDHVAFTSPPLTVSAGACSTEQVTLEFRDAMNRRTDVDSPTTVTLASAPGDLMNANIFFTDAACAVSGAMHQLSPGQGTLSAHLLPRRAGSFTLTASPSAGTASTQQLLVQPAPAARLAFTNGPVVLSTTQSCSAGLFTVQLQDAFDNPSIAATAVPLRVSVSGLVGVTFFEEPANNCTSAPQTDFIIPAGATSVSFRAQGMNASNAAGEVSASVLSGAITAATQVLRISAGTATRFQLAGSPQSPQASVCSANPFTVQLLDSAQNPASSSSPVTITLSTSPALDASFRFFSGAGCATDLGGAITIPPGQTSATFYFRGNRSISSFEILGSSALSAPNTFLPNNSIRPGAPGKLQFSAPLAQTTQASVCTPAPYVANVLDLFDNPTSFSTVQTVTVSSMPVGVTVGASACNTGNTVQLAANSSTVSFTAMHTVTTPTTPYALTASVNGFSTVTPATMNVVPGAPTLRLAAPTSPVTVTANQCLPVRLERRDAQNNLVPLAAASAVTVAPAPSLPGDLTLFSNGDCTGSTTVSVAQGSSSRAFSVRATRAGGPTTYTFTLADPGPGTPTVPMTLTVNPGPTAKLVVNGLPLPIAARACSPSINVRRQDAFDNDVTAEPGFSVAMSSSRFLFSSQPSCTGPATGATVSISSGASTSAEPLYVVGTVAGPDAGVVASANAGAVTGLSQTTIVPGPNHHLAFLDPAGTVAAGDCSSNVRVELRDLDENAITPGSNFNVTLASTPGTPSFYSGAGCTGGARTSLTLTNTNPVRTFSFRPTTAPATETISAAGMSVAAATQSWTVTPGAPNKLVWKQNPTTPAARFTCLSAGVLEMQDSNNNLSPNTSVTPYVVTLAATPATSGITFFSDASCATPITTLSIGMGAVETGEFFMVGTGSSPAMLSATSVPVLTAAPAQSVTLIGTGTFAVTPIDPALEAGACIPLTVERRNASGVAYTSGAAQVNVNVASDIATIHLASDCSDASQILPLTRTIPHGASTTVVYARGRSAPHGATPVDDLFTASEPTSASVSSSATTTLKVYPLVRRGACNIAASFESRCAVTPAIPGDAIDRSFLIFSSTGSQPQSGPTRQDAQDQHVECHLENVSGVEVVCSREGVLGTMSINYQVVSFGRDAASGFGVTVQRQTFSITAASTTRTLTTAVDTSRSFILASNTMPGPLADEAAFPLVKFPTQGSSVSSVDVVGTGTQVRKVSFEVVTMGFPGTVEHVNTPNPAQSSGLHTITTASTPVASTFALAMVQVTANSSDQEYMCKRRFNVKVASPTAITLKRGGTASPSANCTTDPVVSSNVQRINIPSAVVRTPADVTLTSGSTSNNASITSVVTHRSVALLMMQGPGGQSSGESDFASSGLDGDDTGPFHASVDLTNATTVLVTRTVPSNCASVFSPIVVQFDP